jgi:hypothetical protein
MIFMFSPNKLTPTAEADVFRSIPIPLYFLDLPNGISWIGNAPDRCLPVRILLYVSFKHILISLTSFLGIPNSMRIL